MDNETNMKIQVLALTGRHLSEWLEKPISSEAKTEIDRVLRNCIRELGNEIQKISSVPEVSPV